jgi:hypothetical protein
VRLRIELPLLPVFYFCVATGVPEPDGTLSLIRSIAGGRFAQSPRLIEGGGGQALIMAMRVLRAQGSPLTDAARVARRDQVVDVDVPEPSARIRRRLPRVGDKWHLDEVVCA